MVGTKRKFTLFHMSLIMPSQARLGQFIGSRENWIRNALSRDFNFAYRAGHFLHWVPIELFEEYILGVIMRETDHVTHNPPDKGGDEVVRREWQGAYVLVDPRPSGDGQKVAVENDIVGRPKSILAALFGHINDRDDAPYHTEVEQIFDSQEFWTFSERNGNTVKLIRFDFVVPNMWDVEGAVEQDMKEIGKKTGAQRVSKILSSKKGVNTKNKIIESGVAYAQRGAGVVKARAFSGETFVSDRVPVVAELEVGAGDDRTEQVRINRQRIFKRA